jgi:hypothetical protein
VSIKKVAPKLPRVNPQIQSPIQEKWIIRISAFDRPYPFLFFCGNGWLDTPEMAVRFESWEDADTEVARLCWADDAAGAEAIRDAYPAKPN